MKLYAPTGSFVPAWVSGKREVSDRAVRVYALLASGVQTRTKIAAVCGVTADTIKRALRELEEHGAIALQEDGQGRIAGELRVVEPHDAEPTEQSLIADQRKEAHKESMTGVGLFVKQHPRVPHFGLVVREWRRLDLGSNEALRNQVMLGLAGWNAYWRAADTPKQYIKTAHRWLADACYLDTTPTVPQHLSKKTTGLARAASSFMSRHGSPALDS